MDFTLIAKTEKGREALREMEATAKSKRKFRHLVKVERLDDNTIKIHPAGLKMFPNELKQNKQMFATLSAGIIIMMEEYKLTPEDYEYK